jgi:hypothetical protein
MGLSRLESLRKGFETTRKYFEIQIRSVWARRATHEIAVVESFVIRIADRRDMSHGGFGFGFGVDATARKTDDDQNDGNSWRNTSERLALASSSTK